MPKARRRAPTRENPQVDGRSATFVWRGAKPPGLIGDFNDWGRAGTPLKLKARGPRLWERTIKLPRNAYMEYAFVRGRRRVRDPRNPRRVWNGVGQYNHFFYMPEAAPTPLAKRRRGVPRGALSRRTVRAPGLVVGGQRLVHLYRPPTRLPARLVVVYDGPDYLERGGLVPLVENLMAEGRIAPLALAFLANGGAARYLEYACGEATLTFAAEIARSLTRDRLNLIDPDAQPGACGVLGASMGGLMALYSGLRLPRLFGRVISQSGAFTVERPGSVIWDLVRDGKARPVKVWMDIGRYDAAPLIPGNRRMARLLKSRGYEVTCREYEAGHNYTAWRDDVWRGLEALFPPRPKRPR